MKYKGYTIRKKHFYHLQDRGYTHSTANTLAEARRMGRSLADKLGVQITVAKQPYYSIEQDGYQVSTATTLANAKFQVNNRK